MVAAVQAIYDRLLPSQVSVSSSAAATYVDTIYKQTQGYRTDLASVMQKHIELRDWAAADTGVAKHYGYAFQWFALSALLSGLYVWFQLIAPRRHATRR